MSVRNSMISLKCSVCGERFERKRSAYQHSLERGGEAYTPKCSRACVGKAKQKGVVHLICFECGEAIFRSRIEYTKNKKRSKRAFCNRTCSNRCIAREKQIAWKEKRGGVLSSREKRNLSTPRRPALDGVTKGGLFQAAKSWQSARSAIQKTARRLYINSNKPKECLTCGYKGHFQICHKKPVRLTQTRRLLVKLII